MHGRCTADGDSVFSAAKGTTEEPPSGVFLDGSDGTRTRDLRRDTARRVRRPAALHHRRAGDGTGDDRPAFFADRSSNPRTYPTLAGLTQAGTRTNVLGWEEPIYKFVREDGTLRPLLEVGDHPFLRAARIW
jgi:hypothetical protein